MTDARNLCWQCHQPQCDCYKGLQSNAPAAEIDWEKRCERLERENAALVLHLQRSGQVVANFRQALKDVCSPMQMFLRGIPADQRQYVDSGTMVRLCESVGFIQEIARKALEADP